MLLDTPGFFRMGLLGEQILVYGIVFLMCAIIVGIYLYRHRKETKETLKKVAIAKEEGLNGKRYSCT